MAANSYLKEKLKSNATYTGIRRGSTNATITVLENGNEIDTF
jgi:hypothetical protein